MNRIFRFESIFVLDYCTWFELRKCKLNAPSLVIDIRFKDRWLLEFISLEFPFGGNVICLCLDIANTLCAFVRIVGNRNRPLRLENDADPAIGYWWSVLGFQ